MENETENTDSPNSDTPEAPEATDAPEKDKLEETNKQLFERAKKAETENKDLKTKLKGLSEDSKEKPEEKLESKPDTALLEKFDKMTLRSEKITDADEVELANDFKKRTGMEMEEVITDDIFVAKLEKLRDNKANTLATEGIKDGGGGKGSAKDTPEYWIAKGTPPTVDQVPDRKVRAKIARAMMAEEKGIGGSPYYNSKK